MAKLKTIGEETEQNWQALKEHLLDHGLSLEMSPPPRQFAAGFGNLNYLLTIEGKKYVLRRPPLGPIPPGANDMKREYRILSRLHKEYPLAPKAIHFCEDKDIIGADFFIMEYRPGVVIGGSMPEDLQEWQDQQGRLIGDFISEKLIESLAAFHKVNPADVDLDSLGKPEGFNARTLKGWIHRVGLAYDNKPPQVEKEISQWLEENLPEDEDATLIHNDFKLDNMILDAQGLEPMAVIDWDMGTRGSPIYDLCVMLSYWVEPNDPKAMQDLQQMPTNAYGFWSRQQVATRYHELTGFSLKNIKFFRVLAMLRLAGIFVQLNRRYREGGSDDERFATFDVLAEGLMEFAKDIIEDKYF